MSISIAQTTTVGLLKHSTGSTDDGYVLFAPMNDTTTYLIDKCGYVVHKWVSNYRPGLSVYLLPDGNLLRTGTDMESPFRNGGGGGIIEILDWDSNVKGLYKLSTLTECQHHDIKIMPNGNILAIVWDKKNYDEVQIAGRNPALFNKEFWSEQIKELHPIGADSFEIVWEWKIWDHLIQDFDNERANYGQVELHPELIDANYGSAAQKTDWHHMNSVDYNPELDQILVSSRHFNEIWIIDHSATKAQAASHEGGKYGKGGDILYRWGNPEAYRQGTTNDKKLFFQHDAYWIKEGFPFAGNIMVFNNQCVSPTGKFSSVDIIKTPVNAEGFYNTELPYAPAEAEWRYTAAKPTDFFAINLSGAQLLENGNLIVCNGADGSFFEVDTAKSVVWEYMNPVAAGEIVKQGNSPKMTNNVFRCTFYPDDFSGFKGKDLSRLGIIENKNDISGACTLFTSVEEPREEHNSKFYPNPAANFLNIETDLKDFVVEIYDIKGEKRIIEDNINKINTDNLENGIYYVKIFSKKEFTNNIHKFIIWR